MRFAIFGMLLAEAVFLTAPAAAQNPPTPPAIARTVVASTKLADVGASPLYFRALAVTIPPGETSKGSAPDGILYQLSGSTEVTAGGASSAIGPGEAAFIAGGSGASLKAAGGGPSSALHFLLAPVAALGQPAATVPAAVTELYRTPAPIPDLKPGIYDLNLTRVTLSAADAVEPAASPFGRSALLHSLRDRRQYGWGQDDRTGNRILDLRAIRPCPPMGQPRHGAADIPGLQHQPGGCACGRSGGDTEISLISKGMHRDHDRHQESRLAYRLECGRRASLL
jgi:hypothetical protein